MFSTYQYKCLVLSDRDYCWSICIHILPNCSCICSRHIDKLISLCIHQCLLMKQLKNWSEKMSTNLDFTMINFHLRISDHLHGSLEGNGNLMSLSSKLNQKHTLSKKQLQNSHNKWNKRSSHLTKQAEKFRPFLVSDQQPPSFIEHLAGP